MPAPSDWIEHRRGDRELLGWMRPAGDGFVVIDLLGRPVTEPLDWLTAEETLEETGIGYLAEPYELLLIDDGDGPAGTEDSDPGADDSDPEAASGRWLRVRIVEVSTERVLVKKEDWGDVTARAVYYSAPFPVADRLRPLQGDHHVIAGLSDPGS